MEDQATVHEADCSIKPEVKRSGTPKVKVVNNNYACEAADRARDHENIIRNDSAVARSAGFRYFLVRFLGFRCAPPQALCRRPLRGLAGFVFFAERDLLSAFAGVA